MTARYVWFDYECFINPFWVRARNIKVWNVGFINYLLDEMQGLLEERN